MLCGSLSEPGQAKVGEAPDRAVLWEDEGWILCSHTPPERPQTPFPAFIFDDLERWTQTATDPPVLQRGDPTTLTWGFIPDGTAIPSNVCGVGGPASPSDLIAFLDGLYGAGPGGADLTQRPWFSLFEMAFEAWGDVIGIDYLYEPNDDGASFPDFAGGTGSLGARADLRIGGHSLDGQAGLNVLGCNYYPNGGDMILDTDNSLFFGDATNGSRGLRNALAHEHGHGLGIDHVCPVDGTKLMEPSVSTSFDGPQEDDILAGNRGYGDRLEVPSHNDTAGTASALGAISAGGSALVSTLSIDGTTDADFLSFVAAAGVDVTVSLAPTGTTYLSGPQNAMCAGTPFDALVESDLAVELRAQNGATVLASSDTGGAGSGETIDGVPLPSAGTYFVRALGGDAAVDKAQTYQLEVSLIESEADLAITKVDLEDPMPAGGGLTYTVTVTNAGPGTAADVVVTDTLPAGASLVSTSGCAEDPAGVPTCTLGTIANGGEASFSVIVSVDAGTSGNITNQVSVAAATTDPTPGDGDDSESTLVIAPSTCSTAPLVLTAAETGTGSHFLGETTIAAGGGFAVQAMEEVQLRAGSSVSFSDDFSVAGNGMLRVIVDPAIDCAP